MVEVDGEGVVTEQFESLVVVTVHVPHEEVQDGEVHQVQQPPALVVGTDVLDCLTVVRLSLPPGLPSLVVTPPPGMSPGLPGHEVLGGQEGGQADLQQVGAATDGVGGVAVVGTFPVETEVTSWRYEECLQQVSLSQAVDISGTTTTVTRRERETVPGYVEDSARDWNGSPEAHDLVQVEGGHLRVVSLEVGEVEVVGQRLLGPGEPHGLQQGLTSVIEGDDQLELRPSFLLFNTWQEEKGMISTILRLIFNISYQRQEEFSCCPAGAGYPRSSHCRHFSWRC